jgi:hypothetical protein
MMMEINMKVIIKMVRNTVKVFIILIMNHGKVINMNVILKMIKNTVKVF